MEIALLVARYVFVALIYLFVYLVYRGLIAEARAARAEAAARRAQAQVPRMAGPPPPVAPSRRYQTALPPSGAAEAGPVPSGAGPPPARALMPETPALEARSSAASVREALAEETHSSAPSEERPEPQPVPALLATPGSAPEREPAQARESTAAPPAVAVPETAVPTVTPTPATPRLVVLRSEALEVPPGREFPLLAAATIGRAPHNLVVLPDSFVSSQHAIIFLKEGRRVLRDRGSTNGTLVNGHRITGDHILRDGDQITLGTTVLRYTEPQV